MSNVSAGKGILEVAKFAVYVSVPIGLMYFVANDPKNLHKLMGGRRYVVYPPPPSPEEMREIARELAPKRDVR